MEEKPGYSVSDGNFLKINHSKENETSSSGNEKLSRYYVFCVECSVDSILDRQERKLTPRRGPSVVVGRNYTCLTKNPRSDVPTRAPVRSVGYKYRRRGKEVDDTSNLFGKWIFRKWKRKGVGKDVRSTDTFWRPSTLHSSPNSPTPPLPSTQVPSKQEKTIFSVHLGLRWGKEDRPETHTVVLDTVGKDTVLSVHIPTVSEI